MLSGFNVIAFVPTTNAARARDFYEQSLGLTFVREEPWALVFDANGTMLRVQKVEELPSAKHTILGWMVTDIRAVVADLAHKGVVFERYPFLPQDDLRIWTTPDGAMVAWFKDPDGNTLSLTQL